MIGHLISRRIEMKRFTEEVTNPDIVYVAYVDPLAMKETLAYKGNYHNVYDFATGMFCVDRNPMFSQRKTTELAGNRLYKHSPRGLGLAPLDREGKYFHGEDKTDAVWGVAVTGIVEGTDIEGDRKLMFPFNQKKFWEACEELNAELEDGEADWNAQEA